MKIDNRTTRFGLGHVYATPGAAALLTADDMMQSLSCHAAGEDGELDDEDKAANREAIAHGGRVLSAYRAPRGETFWVITEADRSSTTILLPGEY